MHDTGVVVGESKGATRRMLDEIVLLPHLDIVPDYLHEVIPISGRLLVEKAQSVNKFMNNRPLSHASLSDRVSLQVQVLHFALVANVRVTARVFALENCV